MITVAVHPDRRRAVEEFFELFKTEWTVCGPGVSCPVLLTDGTVPSENSASLRIVFSPERQPDDLSSDSAVSSTVNGCPVRVSDGTEFPVYTACRFFNDADEPLITDVSGRVLSYRCETGGQQVIRIGYDLFDEVAHLLSNGQPLDNAAIPALDRQIDFVRNCILAAGFPVVEIPPCPPGHPYMVCLTHDVDFVSIRQYGFGKTFLGFARRALIGSLRRFRRKSLTWRGLLKNYAAVFAVPLIHLRLMKDFWMQFDAYRRLEEPHRSTFFLIPFKGVPGDLVPNASPELRATRYDVEDVRDEASRLSNDGWEIGLHGIDAWHSTDRARCEKERLDHVLNQRTAGIRMHWLCRNAQTDRLLDDAGFDFDSTVGYNETVGFRAGTSQVFMPLQARRLLEIPLHLQDVALFYPAFMDLDERTAWETCMSVLEHHKANGGVLTVLWHMRSLAPERLWGDFYKRLLDQFSQHQAWFGTAGETAEWFRRRRRIHLSHRVASDGQWIVCVKAADSENSSPLTVRIHHPKPFEGSEPTWSDLVWSGQSELHSGFHEISREPSRTGTDLL